jgi:hypothetical protein
MKIDTIIDGHLYSSGRITSWRDIANLDPDLIINTAGSNGVVGSDEVLPRPVYLKWRLEDKPILPDVERLMQIANNAAKWIRRWEKRVLVHDHDGNNRTFLVICAVLWQLKFGDGDDIVDYVRGIHPEALKNKTFDNYVRSLKKK